MPPKKKTGTAHVSEEKSARFATRFYDAFFAPSRLKRKIVVIPRRFLDLRILLSGDVAPRAFAAHRGKTDKKFSRCTRVRCVGVAKAKPAAKKKVRCEAIFAFEGD